jgi:aspartyl-tRNA synthetase
LPQDDALLRRSTHAGFGLGFERTLAYVTGLANVRDAIPFSAHAGEMQGIEGAALVAAAKAFAEYSGESYPLAA